MVRSLLLALAVLLPGIISPAFSQDNKVLRFESIDPQTRLPKGWATGIAKGTSGIQPGTILTTDSIVRQEGRYALSAEFWGTSDFVSVVHTITKRVDATRIKLSGYLKTEDVKGTAGLWMRIDGNERTLAFDNMQARPVTGTTGWTQYEIELAYDKDAADRINVGALLVGTGKIWIDNFRITLDDKDITEAAVYAPLLLPADKDTSNRRGSGIQSITLTPEKIKWLANLGALWGFMKYYHAGIQEGNHNMDAALFRFLPMVLAAKDGAQAMEFMERWVDMFGKPAPCTSCEDTGQITDVALQPDYGVLFRKGNFPPSLIAKLEYIRRNRSRGGPRHYYIGMFPGVGNPQFTNEYAYSDQAYPDAGTRLLALYRYWNSIQYFFPYRHLIGEDWNKVLPEAIPEFCNAADTTAYQLACLKLIARIHDTHANLWPNPAKIQELKGRLITSFRAQFIEGKLVVTGYYKDTLGIGGSVLPGDVIESIDGVPVAELVKRYLPLTPASNYETQLRDLPSSTGFLLRSNAEVSSFRISREGKSLGDVRLRRIPLDGQMRAKDQALFRPRSGFSLLPGNIGYLYPALLNNGSLDSVKKLLHKTDGLIIDLRCYPATFMPFTYGEWLKPRASSFVRFTNGSTNLPGLFVRTSPLSNGKDNKDYYLGKVVIIVNEKAVSNAEYTTMALQTVPGAVTIGSTTAAADGNVSAITLPGGLNTMISGIGVLYPDGTETQRKGVKIDRVIKPTIKGIREGRDELLEEAVRIIAR